MQRFWDLFLQPLVGATRPRVVCEIGALRGGLTERLLDYCAQNGATAYVIDPAPRFDVDAWRDRYGDALVHHLERSLAALPTIPAPDLAFVDGDHNWYTVLNELRLLERGAEAAGTSPPVVAFHDVRWPYGRRDMYYDPETVPEEHRQPYARRGLRPGVGELVDDGVNAELANALLEGGGRNGVLTAIEDYVAGSDVEWVHRAVPGFHGLGLLVPVDRLDARPELASVLALWDDPATFRAHLEAVERARIEEWVEREGSARSLAGELERLQASDTATRAELEALKGALAGWNEQLDQARAELSAASSRAWRYGAKLGYLARRAALRPARRNRGLERASRRLEAVAADMASRR